MKSFEIYFKDLNCKAQARILEEFNTQEEDENWDVFPLAVIERDEEESFEKHQRVEDWKEFSRHMESYIRERTVGKYLIDGGKQMDLMSVSDKRICVWNVLKYALRGMNGSGKKNDLQKMAHYAQLAWTLDGEMVRDVGKEVG